MEIAMACALLLCLLMIVVGIGLWLTTMAWFIKFTLSFLFVTFGVAFGAIGIDLWRDE